MSELMEQLNAVSQRIAVPILYRQITETGPLMLLLGEKYPPRPLTRRQRFVRIIQDTRQRLGEWIAGRAFDE